MSKKQMIILIFSIIVLLVSITSFIYNLIDDDSIVPETFNVYQNENKIMNWSNKYSKNGLEFKYSNDWEILEQENYNCIQEEESELCIRVVNKRTREEIRFAIDRGDNMSAKYFLNNYIAYKGRIIISEDGKYIFRPHHIDFVYEHSKKELKSIGLEFIDEVFDEKQIKEGKIRYGYIIPERIFNDKKVRISYLVLPERLNKKIYLDENVNIIREMDQIITTLKFEKNN